jgi:uncharacterized protein
MTFLPIRSAIANALAALLFSFQPLPAGAHDMNRSITVSASATVHAKPDVARIQTGVLTQDVTARAALTANTQAMTNVIDGLKSLGVEAKDIQTTNFNVNPRYVHHRDGRPPEITGYQVSNEVSVMIRDLSRLGDILDKLISLGSNQLRGLSFEVSNAETLKDAARTQAVKNARRRAELIAKAADAEVGEVLVIREGAASTDGPRPVFEATRAAAQAVPIESGQQGLSATVTVTWALD